MKTNTLVRNRKNAFSLVEMLVVIAVIGILAAIAVPNIGKINNAAEESKNRRNAQQLSSVCNAAAAAGLEFVADGDDVAAVVPKVVLGDKVTDPTSPFVGSYFGVPNLSGDEIDDCQPYLEVREGMLVYKSGLGVAADAGGDGGGEVVAP